MSGGSQGHTLPPFEIVRHRYDAARREKIFYRLAEEKAARW
jgi:hypothetical protein